MLGDTEDEYRRLLYVAMTRAADRLIVGGCMPGNMNTVRKSSWYDLITRGLANSGLKLEELETPAGKVMRYSRPDDVADLTGATASAAAVPIALPSWLRAPAAPEASTAGMLRPSDPVDGDSHPIRTGESVLLRARALQRGTLVHRLLQSLPDIPPDRRGETALAFLARNAGDWSPAEREALAAQVLALTADPKFAAVFAAGSRAEVAIAGRVKTQRGGPALVSGQIDRLVVTPDAVLIVDFKTNHAPPSKAADAPQAYIRQLALYRAVLGKLYPDRPVKAALLWTETPEMMEISGSALDAELAAIISV